MQKLITSFNDNKKFCEILNKHTNIDDIYNLIMDDDIIRTDTTYLDCSISNGNVKCNKPATHLVLCKDHENQFIHLCWSHCFELYGKVMKN